LTFRPNTRSLDHETTGPLNPVIRRPTHMPKPKPKSKYENMTQAELDALLKKMKSKDAETRESARKELISVFASKPANLGSAVGAGLSAGYNVASAKDSAYQRYIKEHYGPNATSHNSEPMAMYTGSGAGPNYAGTSRDRAGPGAGLSSPAVSYGDASEPTTSAAHEALYRAISEAEGTTQHGYNTIYGGGQRDLGNMTIREVMDMQSNMINQTGHSPVGRFQITRDTLGRHAGLLGIPDTAKFTPDIQNKVMLSIADKQGLKPSTWAGFNNNPGAFARAKQAYSTIQQATPAQASYATSGYTGAGASGITYNIRDKTSAQGLTSGLMGALESAQQAARAAGLDHIEVRAGKGQGHLSHQQGTEADIVGYNADGSQWSKAQRVAVAQGAAGAGANRFGFYSGPTLHVGMGAKGLPGNVVWNDKLRGVPGVNTFAPEERDFVGALRTGKLKSLAPVTAYAPTTALSPAQQAAALQASGQASGTTTNTTPDPKVAQMQRDLNSRGANLEVDGLRGPLTRAAEQQFYGSPTSVRTPSITASAPTTGNTWSSVQGPYTSSTGGANAVVSSVRTPSFTAAPRSYTSGRGDEGAGAGVASPPSMGIPRRVETTAVDASGYPPISSGFTRAPTPQTPYYSNPYTMGTGGANAIVARTPQARPPQAADTPTPYLNQPYAAPSWGAIPQAPLIARLPVARPPGLQWSQLQQSAPPPPVQEAVPSFIDRLKNLIDLDPNRAKTALTSLGSVLSGGNQGGAGTRGAGASYSGSGGNYSGGNYGGQGGRTISQGVGGAYRNR